MSSNSVEQNKTMKIKQLFLQELLDMDLYFHNQEKAGNVLTKCSEISEQARKDGNKLYTQKHHNKQIHQEILALYTKSIAFAPTDDEKLALGYSNRSALLMHLQRYEDCIIDIDRAMKIVKSEELKSKLDGRKAKCLEYINETKMKQEPSNESVKSCQLSDEEIAGTVFELPNIINSAEILRLSESVSLKYNKIHGRHYVANKDIKPGDIVIAEKTYVCFPEVDQIYLVCSHCLCSTWVGIPCDYCAYSIYCSEACKNAAWQEYHDIECAVLPYMYSNKDLFRVEIGLATRLLIKAVTAEGFQNIIDFAKDIDKNDNGMDKISSDVSSGKSTFGTCYNLQSYPNKRQSNEESTFYEGFIIYLLYKYTNIIYKEEKPEILNICDNNIFILKIILMKIGDIINLNQYCFQSGCTCPNILNECESDCDFAKGHFIAPFSSLVNHSCIPNVLMLCLPQQTVVLYAIQPIKKDEQILYTYGPMLDGVDTTDRNGFLQDHYYFTCQCAACKENWLFNYNPNPSQSDLIIYTKLLLKFEQYLQTAEEFKKNQFLNKLPNEWQQIDEVSLHQALKLCELSYRFFKNQAAFNCNLRYKRYVRKALYKLYGEKYDMPEQC